MKITLQNQNEHTHSISSQQAGELPILMGPMSSAEVSPARFLIFEALIRKSVADTRPGEKMRLVLSADTEADRALIKGDVLEIAPDQILDGFRQGVFGPEVVALVTKSDAAKALHLEEMKAWQAEQKIRRQEMLGHASMGA